MKSLIEYQQDIKEADEVRRIDSMPEFACIKRLLKRMRDSDIEKIIAEEDVEARARIKCFQDIADEIVNTIQRGNIASEAIKEGRIQENPQGE
jgi:hypothetical protein